MLQTILFYCVFYASIVQDILNRTEWFQFLFAIMLNSGILPIYVPSLDESVASAWHDGSVLFGIHGTSA